MSHKGPCVIVDRCADFILKSNPRCFNIFVHADKIFRLNRTIENYGVPAAEAEEKLEEMDKERENHYRHYTGRQWRDAKNYHLTVDISLFGIEKAAQIIIDSVAGSNGMGAPVPLTDTSQMSCRV